MNKNNLIYNNKIINNNKLITYYFKYKINISL